MDHDTQRRILKLAADQCNVVTRAQAMAEGASSAGIARLVRDAVWVRLYRGVYAVAPYPDTGRQRLVAARLAAGESAVASHETALRLHGIEVRVPRGVVHLTVPSCKTRDVGPGVVVHTTRSLIAEECRVVEGVPTTDVARALADVAWTRRRELERLTFEALRLGVADAASVTERLDRLGARKGAAQLRGILEVAEQRGAQRLRSFAETVATQVFVSGGLDLVAGYQVVVDGRIVAELDFADPQRKVAVEIDGYRFHATPEEKRYDDRRQNLLVGLGWTVLRYTLDDLQRRPAQVLREVAAALAAADRRLAP